MKTKNIVTACIVTLCIVILFSAVFVEAKKTDESQNTNDHANRRAFYDLAQNVNDIYASLLKCSLSSDSYQLVYQTGKIYENCASAITNLSQIPNFSEPVLNIAKFLSQAGDFSHQLSLNHLNGEPQTQQEIQMLKSLTQYAKKLSDALSDISEKLSDGMIGFSDTQKQLSKKGIVSQSFIEIEQSDFSDYPGLIYDGMFSEHVNTEQNLLKENYLKADRATAQKAAQQVVGDAIELVMTAEVDSEIAAYNFTGTKSGAQYSVQISKHGAKCINMMVSRTLSDPTESIDSAIVRAKKFLLNIGLSDMQTSYYEVQGTSVTINFAGVQDGIIMYPDLVKVKVALDNGDIIGYEAHGYLLNHKKRTIAPAKITEAKASEHLTKNFSVDTIRQAVIPTDSGKEVHCYEIKGTQDGHTFLVYVNAETGREENILLLVENENGTLTI